MLHSGWKTHQLLVRTETRSINIQGNFKNYHDLPRHDNVIESSEAPIWLNNYWLYSIDYLICFINLLIIVIILHLFYASLNEKQCSSNRGLLMYIYLCVWYMPLKQLSSHPGNRGTYCFWSVSAAVSATAVSAAVAVVLPTLFNFPGEPLKLISSNHTRLTYGCGKNFWHSSRWPWVTKLPKRDAIYLVPMIKREPLIQ